MAQMQRPRVSVVVPIYRVERYLNQCVDSLIGQTLKDIQIILVDDGSPDGCGAIIDAYAAKDGRVLALVSDCKYGFRLSGEDLFVTLINTGYNPDPYPERGIHDVTLFLLADEASGAALARQTDICLNPLQYITGSVHSGSWADTGSFLQAQGESAVFCSISRKNGKLTLRAYEAEGKVCPVTVTVRGDVKAAVLTDLFGSPTGQPVETIGSTVRFTLQPYTTVQLQIG